MTLPGPSSVVALVIPWSGPPLDPSSDRARSWLQRELLDPDYHQQNLVERLVTWLQRLLERGLTAARDQPPLATFAAMLVLLLLLTGLAWLVSRARASHRVRTAREPVLAAERLTADELRARADAAAAAGRPSDAVLDGFRALAMRQVERGRLEDAPGATVREVCASLEATYPDQAADIGHAGLWFELVRYGSRPVTADQAREVLALDDTLVARR